MEEKKLLIDVEETPKKFYQWMLFSLQHVLAVLVGTITAPMLIPGFPVAAAMLSAGIGTLFYIAVTRKKSPVFLSSNFTYIAPITSALAIGGIANAMDQAANYAAVMVGMAIVGLTYVILAIIVKYTGTAWINKLLPPTVIGPTIMIIGLSLATTGIFNLTNVRDSVTNATSYNLVGILCGLVAMLVTAWVAHYSKNKMIKLIPFIIGMLSGYILALLFTLIGFNGFHNEYFRIIDFQPFVDAFGPGNIGLASFINYKMFTLNDPQSFLFLRIDQLKQFDWASIIQIFIIFVPVALVSACEHIGDHKNLGNIIGRDLVSNEPGLTKTLIGDGVGTAISGQLCGLANTTYGESIALIGTTRIASGNVIVVAALMMCAFSFFTPITIFLSTIPQCIMGGISLFLYGFISMSGMRVLQNAHIDFNKNKNIFIVSAILVSGIGGFSLKFGAPLNPVVEISPVALAMILGILLNVTLKEKKKVNDISEKKA